MSKVMFALLCLAYILLLVVADICAFYLGYYMMYHIKYGPDIGIIVWLLGIAIGVVIITECSRCYDTYKSFS